jgi:hypothetical protein
MPMFQRVGDHFHVAIVVFRNPMRRFEGIEADEPELAVLDRGADVIDSIGIGSAKAC